MTWRQIVPGVFQGIPGQEETSELEGRIRLSKIPLNTIQTHRLHTWQHRQNETWWEEIEKYTKGDYEHPFVTFLGMPGTGKTHLALGLGWDWLGRGKTVLYYHAADFLNALRDGFRRSGETDYFHTISFAKNCSLLILDDLGAERETEFATEQLDLVVDHRYENLKPLIVTTNLALDLLPPRIADRLREGRLIHLKGESYRKKKGKGHEPI